LNGSKKRKPTKMPNIEKQQKKTTTMMPNIEQQEQTKTNYNIKY
jgi:hypothetical protein